MGTAYKISPTINETIGVSTESQGCLLTQEEFHTVVVSRERVSVLADISPQASAFHCPLKNDVLIFRECPFTGEATFVGKIDMNQIDGEP